MVKLHVLPHLFLIIVFQDDGFSPQVLTYLYPHFIIVEGNFLVVLYLHLEQHLEGFSMLYPVSLFWLHVFVLLLSILVKVLLLLSGCYSS